MKGMRAGVSTPKNSEDEHIHVSNTAHSVRSRRR